jgi:hypothetical protein
MLDYILFDMTSPQGDIHYATLKRMYTIYTIYLQTLHWQKTSAPL